MLRTNRSRCAFGVVRQRLADGSREREPARGKPRWKSRHVRHPSGHPAQTSGRSERPRRRGAQHHRSPSATSFITSRRPELAGVKEPAPAIADGLIGPKFVICSTRSRTGSKGPRMYPFDRQRAGMSLPIPTLCARRPILPSFANGRIAEINFNDPPMASDLAGVLRSGDGGDVATITLTSEASGPVTPLAD